jgi:hypothetical protein
MGFIHSKLRNCLGHSKVNKLTYVKINAADFSVRSKKIGILAVSSDSSDSSEEESQSDDN